MEIPYLILACFGLAALSPLLHRMVGGKVGLLNTLLPLAITGLVARHIGAVGFENAVESGFRWLPTIGLSFSFYLDGLSVLFAVVVATIGALVLVYSTGYFRGKPEAGVFQAYMLLFMASMLGLVLAGNVLTLYVFWELTTLSSFLLIGFEHRQEASRHAAVQALLVTAVGGLSMLAGMLLLGQTAGAFDLATILERGDTVRQHPHYPAILVLILLGAFTKSAQFPFHFWLPNAMKAPTPVSAYLHSAAMVKAGVYLLARLHPVLGGTELWEGAVTAVGAMTMFAGAYLAFFAHDLKMILAYLTINVLGTLVMLLGVGTHEAVKAALTYLTAHALYKAALFLFAGAVDHETGTRDLRELSGLRQFMPASCTAAFVSALSMAGVAPLFGYVAKEMYLDAVWHAPLVPAVLTGVSVAASLLLVAGAWLVGIAPVFGRPSPAAEESHEAGFTLWAPPLLLAAGSLMIGVFPQKLVGPLVEGGVSSVLQESAHVELKLWHGFTVPLFLSIAALLGGTILYLARRPIVRGVPGENLGRSWGPDALYDRAVNGLLALAKWQTHFFQSGYLRLYLVTVILSVTLLLAWVLPVAPRLLEGRDVSSIYFHDVAISVLVLGAALMAVFSRSRLTTIAALTGVGFGVAWIFGEFSAPDLAMTQIVIETLATVLMVLAFRRLPKFKHLSNFKTQFRDAVLALSAGGMLTVLLLLATASPRSLEVPSYYARKSVPEGHGRNIVNVILVDFRALDTVGEITAISAAALGAYWLLTLPKKTTS